MIEKKYILPRAYLSYSSISLWQKDKNKFRRRYYLNEKDPDNVFSLFGREAHAQLEQKENLSHIPRFSVPEKKIKIKVKGIPILAYLDNFAPKRRSFLDFKTGIKNPDGTDKWTQLAVEKLDQLPFYSFIIKKKYGKVYPVCKLIYLETRWKKVMEQVGSRIIEGEGNQLELTGDFKIFKRKIKLWEHKRIEKMIVKAAEEISEDYQNWLKNK